MDGTDLFTGCGSDISQFRRRLAPLIAAASAFREAVSICSELGRFSVYWKSVGFDNSSLDNEFVALCCKTATPLSGVGQCHKFEINPRTGLKKAEFVCVHPHRINISQRCVRVPGSHGFCLFGSPSSTLVVPGRTRKHRCAAVIPVSAEGAGEVAGAAATTLGYSPIQFTPSLLPVPSSLPLRNIDGMAHLGVAMAARNGRVALNGQLVRDEDSQVLQSPLYFLCLIPPPLYCSTSLLMRSWPPDCA